MKKERLIKAAEELNQKKGLHIPIINISYDKLKLSIIRNVKFILESGLSDKTIEVINAVNNPVDYVIEHLLGDLPQIIHKVTPIKKGDYTDLEISFRQDLTESELKSVNDKVEELVVEVKHLSASEATFCIRSSF